MLLVLLINSKMPTTVWHIKIYEQAQERGIKKFDNLVHDCNHSLPTGDTFRTVVTWLVKVCALSPSYRLRRSQPLHDQMFSSPETKAGGGGVRRAGRECGNLQTFGSACIFKKKKYWILKIHISGCTFNKHPDFMMSTTMVYLWGSANFHWDCQRSFNKNCI